MYTAAYQWKASWQLVTFTYLKYRNVKANPPISFLNSSTSTTKGSVLGKEGLCILQVVATRQPSKVANS
jgi:hypothetical protein